MSFTVLTVCKVNVCRSPLLAVELYRHLGPEVADSVRVVSAGLDAVEGQRTCPDMMRLAALHATPAEGLARLEEHVSRALTPQMVAAADLILAADRQVRSGIVKVHPRVAEHTFTVREAAALATALAERPAGFLSGYTSADRLRAATLALNQSRGFTDLPRVERRVRLAPPWRWPRVHAHDVPDAHTDDPAPHRLVHELAAEASRRLGDSLALSIRGSVA